MHAWISLHLNLDLHFKSQYIYMHAWMHARGTIIHPSLSHTSTHPQYTSTPLTSCWAACSPGAAAMLCCAVSHAPAARLSYLALSQTPSRPPVRHTRSSPALYRTPGPVHTAQSPAGRQGREIRSHSTCRQYRKQHTRVFVCPKVSIAAATCSA